MPGMLNSALSSVTDAGRLPFLRVKWARVAMCLFAEVMPAENITAAVLVTATRCLDVPAVVRVLVSGVWGVYGAVASHGSPTTSRSTSRIWRSAQTRPRSAR